MKSIVVRDDVHRFLKTLAASSGYCLCDVVDDLLRVALRSDRRVKSPSVASESRTALEDDTLPASSKE